MNPHLYYALKYFCEKTVLKCSSDYDSRSWATSDDICKFSARDCATSCGLEFVWYSFHYYHHSALQRELTYDRWWTMRMLRRLVISNKRFEYEK